MAAPPKKRLRLLENHICSEEVGARGLTYDETSVVYSLLWNQPSLLPSPYCYTGRRATPLVGKGAKGKAVGLPLFYTASPYHPIRERDERGKEEETEIREAHPSTVQPVQPWRLRKRKVVDYIPSSPEAGIGERVRSELGYLFPPVMGKMVENHVQSRWLKQRNTGDQSREEEKVYQQMVVDAQVFLAREIERKLASCDSDSHDSDSGEGE